MSELILDAASRGITSVLYDHIDILSHVRDPNGASPLLRAARHGHLDSVKLIYGAHPQLLRVKDRSEDDPLCSACEGGHLSIVSYFLDIDIGFLKVC